MARSLNSEHYPASGWRPNLRFWITHLLLPLAAFAVLATLLETTGFELWLADRWYAAEGGHWALRHHWLTYEVMHHYGKLMVLTAGMTLLILILASFRVTALRRWRRPLTYLLTSMALLPAVIAKMKHASLAPCPWDLARYGGEFIYHHTTQLWFWRCRIRRVLPVGACFRGLRDDRRVFCGLPLRAPSLAVPAAGPGGGDTFCPGAAIARGPLRFTRPVDVGHLLVRRVGVVLAVSPLELACPYCIQGKPR